MRYRPCALALSCGLASCFLCANAAAVDRFEIQVYQAEVNKPGQFGLELHSNYTLKGLSTPEYDGHTPSHHVGRFTLEPAIGVTDWFEVGAYLQTMVGPDQGAQWGGMKGRLKFVVPERLKLPVFLGINVEVGRVPRWVDQDGWANEFRPIVGYYNGVILANINPIFGYGLSGSEKFKPHFEPATKLAFNTQLGFMLGAEYYAGFGHLSNLLPVKRAEHLLFATFDLASPAHETEESEEEWEVNVAVGRALNDVTDPEWIVKSIVGRSF